MRCPSQISIIVDTPYYDLLILLFAFAYRLGGGSPRALHLPVSPHTSPLFHQIYFIFPSRVIGYLIVLACTDLYTIQIVSDPENPSLPGKGRRYDFIMCLLKRFADKAVLGE